MPIRKLPLCGRDLAELRSSGVTDETIRANRLRTKNDALEYPYRGLDGIVNCFVRRKPHRPRLKDGKLVKYEQPPNEAPRAYFAAATVAKVRESNEPLYVVEGEKKALALSQLRLAVVGLGGVDSFKSKDSDDLIPSLAEIDWTGRDVYIVFDYDSSADTRYNVANARKRLAAKLCEAGASAVYNVELPPAPDGAKQGVDDYLVSQGKRAALAFRMLVEQARNNVIKIISPAQATGPITVIKIIPPTLGESAYHGLAGEFIRSVAPYTEATDAAILAHLLPAVGTLVGPGPHVWAGGRQPTRVNVGVVGPTSRGRKGTAAGIVDYLLNRVDDHFWSEQRVSGLSSGEGLIARVADRWEKNADGESEETVVEKRLYVLEPEFARVLANTRREGNVLSHVIREAFDSGNLSTLTVTPRHAVGAHVSIVAHITPEELAARLNHIEMANGFGNRFLWFYVSSDKLMPHTEPIPGSVFLPFEKRLRALLMLGAKCKDHPVKLSAPAASLWEQEYPKLREDRPGLAGAMTARGPAMVLRVALTYSMLEIKRTGIEIQHLEAALAVWRYCEESAQKLFGALAGDTLGDKLLDLLCNGPMSKSDFNRHLSADQKDVVDATLAHLERTKVIRKSLLKRKSAGRPATVWERLPANGSG